MWFVPLEQHLLSLQDVLRLYQEVLTGYNRQKHEDGDLIRQKTCFNALLKLKVFTEFSANIFSSSLNLDGFGLLLSQISIIYFISSLLC